jgi:F-type H+-transporting ATPase subunit delta
MFAEETIGFEQALEELRSLKNVIRVNPEFVEFLSNPEIQSREKMEFVDNSLKDNFSKEMRDFLKMLIEKRRIKQLVGICDYVRVTYSHDGAVETLLKSSYPLDLETIRKIKIKLEDKLQKRINLHLELDGRLLGGIQVRIGNTVIDGSVKRRIQDLKEKLMSVEV